MTFRKPTSMTLALATVTAFAACVASSGAEARMHHQHHRHHRVLLVSPGGLIPGTYAADYGQPGYGCRTSILAGNFGGCGTGWAYDGGPGFGYR